MEPCPFSKSIKKYDNAILIKIYFDKQCQETYNKLCIFQFTKIIIIFVRKLKILLQTYQEYTFE